MKRVKWVKEWDGGKYPYCPHCNELAIDKDYCVFCLKEYKWRGKSRVRTVVVGDYIVRQTSSKHVSITKGDRMVYHAQCTKRLSKRQLKNHVKFYEDLVKERELNDG